MLKSHRGHNQVSIGKSYQLAHFGELGPQPWRIRIDFWRISAYFCAEIDKIVSKMCYHRYENFDMIFFGQLSFTDFNLGLLSMCFLQDTNREH